MILGSLGIFFVSLIEGQMYKVINNSPNRNFMTFLFYIIAVLGLIILSAMPMYLVQDEFNLAKEFSFLYEKWFYVVLCTETLGMWLYREAYKVYDKNYTIVNMFMFSTVFLMPLYAYLLSDIVGLNQTIMVIDSLQDAVISSFSLFIGTAIYFYNKFKLKEITNLKILILLSLMMLNNFYFTTKLVQTYNGTLLYSILLIVLSLNFLAFAINKKESLKLETKSPMIYIALFFKLFANYIYVKSIAFIPVEIAPIVRRIGQLFAGLAIDKKIPSKSESLGIFIIIFVFVYNFIK